MRFVARAFRITNINQQFKVGIYARFNGLVVIDR
jgi:hypothetical protein